MAVYLCNRSLNARVDPRACLASEPGDRAHACVYALFRGVDLITHGGAAYLFRWREESSAFWLEIVLFVIAPVFLLTRTRCATTPQYLVLDVRAGRHGIHGQPPERLDHRISGQFRLLLRSQVDGVCTHARDRHGSSRCISLCGDLSGNSAEKCSSEELDVYTFGNRLKPEPPAGDPILVSQTAGRMGF